MEEFLHDFSVLPRTFLQRLTRFYNGSLVIFLGPRSEVVSPSHPVGAAGKNFELPFSRACPKKWCGKEKEGKNEAIASRETSLLKGKLPFLVGPNLANGHDGGRDVEATWTSAAMALSRGRRIRHPKRRIES